VGVKKEKEKESQMRVGWFLKINVRNNVIIAISGFTFREKKSLFVIKNGRDAPKFVFLRLPFLRVRC